MRAAAGVHGRLKPAPYRAPDGVSDFPNLPPPRKPGGAAASPAGRSNGTPRSVAFNVQAFRIAVNKRTGAIKILRSVHAADAGRVINPMQCRGQIEGGVAQSLGATLYEEMVIDDAGRVVNPTFRNYHLPQFADVPRTEVMFADTSDAIGPFGAKSMSESPYNPVSAAMGNALADATGIRFCQTPFKPDRIFRASPKSSAPRIDDRSETECLDATQSREVSAPEFRRRPARTRQRQSSVRLHPGRAKAAMCCSKSKTAICRIAT